MSKLLKTFILCRIIYGNCFLTLPVPCISESCIEIKIKLNFYFHTSLWCLKQNALKAFIKPFEAPKRKVKIKISLIFFYSSGTGTGRVKTFLSKKNRSAQTLYVTRSSSSVHKTMKNKCSDRPITKVNSNSIFRSLFLFARKNLKSNELMEDLRVSGTIFTVSIKEIVFVCILLRF